MVIMSHNTTLDVLLLEDYNLRKLYMLRVVAIIRELYLKMDTCTHGEELIVVN